jgi:hypothetical protein
LIVLKMFASLTGLNWIACILRGDPRRVHGRFS